MRAQRLLIALLLAGGGAGCTSMKTVQPAQVIPLQRPAFVWVYTGHIVTEVLAPRIDGDTLRGKVADLGDPFAVSLKDIVKVKARERDGTRTALLIGGSVVVGAFVVVQLFNSGSAPATDTCTPAELDDGTCTTVAPQ